MLHDKDCHIHLGHTYECLWFTPGSVLGANPTVFGGPYGVSGFESGLAMCKECTFFCMFSSPLSFTTIKI